MKNPKQGKREKKPMTLTSKIAPLERRLDDLGALPRINEINHPIWLSV